MSILSEIEQQVAAAEKAAELTSGQFDSSLLNLPKPLHDRVLVRRVDQTERIGSIFIPDVAKEKPLEAEVLAVGPGRRRDDKFCPTAVKVGQKVLLSPSVNRGWADIIEGSGITMINEQDILGVFEG